MLIEIDLWYALVAAAVIAYLAMTWRWARYTGSLRRGLLWPLVLLALYFWKE